MLQTTLCPWLVTLLVELAIVHHAFTCIAPASSRVNRNLTNVKRGNRQLNDVPKVHVTRPGLDLC
jgi:hypothetical protein